MNGTRVLLQRRVQADAVIKAKGAYVARNLSRRLTDSQRGRQEYQKTRGNCSMKKDGESVNECVSGMVPDQYSCPLGKLSGMS